MANPIVRNFIAKKLFEKGGAIANRKAVDFSTNALETRLTNAGIDLNIIKSPKDLDQALAFVKQLEDQIFAKQFKDTLNKKETAKIFDLEGKKLDPNEPIMGGTQEESIKKNIAEATKKGDFTGIKNQILRDPDIAREFALSKKFPFRRDTNVRSGADAIPLARKAEFDEEMGIKSMAKDRDYSVEKLVKDFKKFGNATDDDIQTILKSGKSGQIPYVMDNYGMSYTEVLDTLKSGKPLIEGLAKGGRAGFDNGSEPVDLDEIQKVNESNPKSLLDLLDIQASGSKSGKQDIPDAPEGVTTDAEQYNIIANLEIPITQKIKLLANLVKGKNRNRIEKDDNELFMIDDGYKNRNVGLSFNEGGEGLSAKFMKNIDTGNDDFRIQLLKRFAKGGRAGFKIGSKSKRAFLKAMGGLTATIAAIKSGLIGVPKKEVAKQVVKESVKDVSNAPPEYFFSLANKIKNLGKESKVKPQERVNEYNYKGKDGSEYTLTEDIGTGDMQIVKEKGGVGIADDKTFDTIQDRTVMDYKAPKQDFDPDTEKILKEGAEYDEYRVNFDRDGTPADADEISDIIKKEIIEESSEIPQKKIKRAGGGVAYMLGE